MNELARTGPASVTETAQAAAAAASKAAITTRYELALMRPRDLDAVRQRLLKECDRPSFAQAAIYRKPVGSRWNPEKGEFEDAFVEGLSIRFAEAARRIYGNTYDEATCVFEDPDKILYRVTAMDLESNSTTAADLRIEKTVERTTVREGQEIVGERVNSRGKKVFVIRATDDEIRGNIKREIPKELREALLSLIPGDLLVECEAACRKTRAKEDARDPDKARRDIIDSFAAVGVPVEELAGYVGHALDHLDRAELEELRAIYTAVRDGEAKWRQFAEDRGTVDAKGKPTAAAKRVDAVLERAKKNLEQKAKAQKTEGAPAPTTDASAPAATPAAATHDPAAGEVPPEAEPK